MKRVLSAILAVVIFASMFAMLSTVSEATTTYPSITANSIRSANIKNANDSIIFKFVPSYTGNYTFTFQTQTPRLISMTIHGIALQATMTAVTTETSLFKLIYMPAQLIILKHITILQALKARLRLFSLEAKAADINFILSL